MYAFTGGHDPLKRENAEKRNNEKNLSPFCATIVESLRLETF